MKLTPIVRIAFTLDTFVSWKRIVLAANSFRGEFPFLRVYSTLHCVPDSVADMVAFTFVTLCAIPSEVKNAERNRRKKTTTPIALNRLFFISLPSDMDVWEYRVL